MTTIVRNQVGGVDIWADESHLAYRPCIQSKLLYCRLVAANMDASFNDHRPSIYVHDRCLTVLPLLTGTPRRIQDLTSSGRRDAQMQISERCKRLAAGPEIFRVRRKNSEMDLKLCREATAKEC